MQASDVYALAVTLNEVATGTIPFSDCSKDNPACHTVLDAGYGHQELLAAVVAEQLRPCLPAACPPAWAPLMAACWHEQPDARPSCAQVLEALSQLAAEERVPELPQPLPFARLLRRHCDPAESEPAAEQGAADAQRAASVDGFVAEHPAWQVQANCEGSYRPHVAAGAFEDAGLRGTDKMEDRHVVACPLAGTHGAALLAVCDGHRGARAAAFVAAQLPQLLRTHWAGDSKSAAGDVGSDFGRSQEHHAVPAAEDALAAALKGCEAAFANSEHRAWAAQVQRMGSAAAGARTWPGAAVVAAVQTGQVLAWANLGDCRAVLCQSGRPVQLTRDHVVSDAKEQALIVSRGGVVRTAHDGSLRVGDAQLQVSRSMGDLDAKQQGVSAEPETGSCMLRAHDEFLILASDGLWDVVSNGEAVAIVHDTVKNPSMAAKRLVVEALARGSGDNVTALVCFLRPSEVLESVYKDGMQKYAPAATHYGSRAAVLAQLATQTAADEVSERL